MTAPDRVAVEAAARVRAFLNAWDAAGLRNNIRFFEPDPTAIPAHMEKLTGSDLRAVLAELERVEQERDEDLRVIARYLRDSAPNAKPAAAIIWAHDAIVERFSARAADLAARDEREGDRG